MLRDFVFALMLVCASFSHVDLYCLNTEDVTVITANEKNTYFGYSLLLQRGQQPSVLVGAPKQKNTNSGGSIYRCFLEGQTGCKKLQVIADSKGSFGGNCLGMALDGDDTDDGLFVVTAPRIVTYQIKNYFLSGHGFVGRNSTIFRHLYPLPNDPIGSNYYNNGFAEAGFDVSYSKDIREILMGAPGLKSWNGAMVVIDEYMQSVTAVLPSSGVPVTTENDSYFGYKITSARFDMKRNRTWYVVGAPRGQNMNGYVLVFEYDVTAVKKMRITAKLEGQELGSYFGSSLLTLDVTNDRIDDLFIGAPMGSGKTWEEGYVHFYKVLGPNERESVVKLIGSGKSGSRFGTAIVSLGDIDQDSFNDVAISAPYENNGIGAVYVYRGSSNGIQKKYSQRLSPLEMSIESSVKNIVRGFGLGISKGNDIDNNGHSDIAIGAYKSDQLFIVKSKSVIDYRLYLTSNITTLSTNVTYFDIIYCLYYTQRSGRNIITSLTFNLTLLLDYRAKNGTGPFKSEINVDLGQNFCKSQQILLKDDIQDISPFKIVLKVDLNRTDIIAEGEKKSEHYIHFSHGCGDDNQCDTDLVVDAQTDSSEITLGINDEVILNVTVENYGEPAYRCELFIEIPSYLALRNVGNCNLRNKNVYVCPFNDRLVDFNQKQCKFDITSMDPDTKEIVIKLNATSVGKNKGNRNTNVIKLPVKLQNTPYISGKSEPETMAIDDQVGKTNTVQINHVFSLSNSGPSPLKSDVNILVPTFSRGDGNLYQVTIEVKGVETSCEGFNFNPVENTNENSLTLSLDKTILFSCSSNNSDCLEFRCRGDYLSKNSDTAVIKLKILLRSDFITSIFDHEPFKKDILAFVSTAYVPNNEIKAQSVTVFLAPIVKIVPVWIYVTAALAGCLLLVLLIFALYKCNFFDRNYKDKLNQEKLLDKAVENRPHAVENVMDDVELTRDENSETTT